VWRVSYSGKGIPREHLLRRLIKSPKEQLSRKSPRVRLCPNHAVTPAKAGVQLNVMSPVPNHLDSGFHRNDKKDPAVSLLDDPKGGASESVADR